MIVIPSFIIGLAILPAIILFIYIYKKDTYKEPLGLLFCTFIAGMISAPTSTFFSSMVPATIEAGAFGKAVYSAFLQAAIPEELSKFLLLYLVIWNNRNFDEMFDGIVYASCIGLGFAALENILYVANFGPGVLMGRAILAIPGHFFFAVAMGFFFSLAKFAPRYRKLFMCLTLAVPMLLHGCYDGLLMWAENLDKDGFNGWFSIVLSIVFYAFVIGLWKMGMRRISAFQSR